MFDVKTTKSTVVRMPNHTVLPSVYTHYNGHIDIDVSCEGHSLCVKLSSDQARGLLAELKDEIEKSDKKIADELAQAYEEKLKTEAEAETETVQEIRTSLVR